MAEFKTLDDVDVAGKRVLVRVDLNVPVNAAGKISDTTRITRVAPTISEISEKGGKVILLAHFGRPKGKIVPDMSLSFIAPAIAEIIGKPVSFASDCIGDPAKTAIDAMANGDIVLLENTRFHPGEMTNDEEFSKALATNGDIYINDAFSAAHRAHGSTQGITNHLPSYAGRTMQAELDALQSGLGNPQKPIAALVGGAKVSSKLSVLEHLVEKVDYLIIGGGMANTFLAAQGINVGKSLCEHNLLDTANRILEAADANDCIVVLPVDAITATKFEVGPATKTVSVNKIDEKAMMLDVGPSSILAAKAAIKACKTLIWNGPMGAFETPPFDIATIAIARTAAEQTLKGELVSVAGGGDTVAALGLAGVKDDFSYVSTAGGAFLEWMEGKALPGVEALRT